MSARSAKSTITYYFKLASRGGWDWDFDNTSELHGVIDDIIDAAQRPLLKRIEKLEAALGVTDEQ